MKFPNEIVLETTKKCNLNCSFCYNDQGKTNNELSTDAIEKVLTELAKQGVKKIRFTGGEPFLRKEFHKILKSAKSKGFFIIINTNGTLLHENKSLLTYADIFLLSMHTPDQLENVKSAIKILEDKTFMLATIALRQNIHRLSSFYDFVSRIKEEGHNLREWFLLRPVHTDNKRMLSTQDIQLLREYIYSNNRRYNMNVKIANALPLCAVKDLPPICKGGHFDEGHTRLFIDTEGDIYSDYFKQQKIGSIFKNSVQEAWNSPFLREKRKYKNFPPSCKECHMLEKCKGGLNGDTPLINPENLKPIISVVLKAKKTEIHKILKALSEQRCRKNAFEVIVPYEYKNLKEHNEYKKLRIKYAKNEEEALQEARGHYRITLDKKDIPNDFILQYISRKRKE